MINSYGNNVGSTNGTTSTSNNMTIPPYTGNVSIVRDTSTGEQGSPDLDTLYSAPLQGPTDIRKNVEENANATIINLGIRPQLFSGHSGQIPFETFFHDFELQAFPFYNFWTVDELSNDKETRGNRKEEDIPRYIRLQWKVAPKFENPYDASNDRGVNTRPIRPVIFSREIERPTSFSEKGATFTPEHLQASGFSKIKSMLANSYLAPGVIETVVEMPLNGAGVESYRVNNSIDSIEHIDEDSFLTDQSMAGISIHELSAQISQVSNAIASMPYVGTSATDTTIRKSLVPGGEMQISNVDPSSPNLSFRSNVATNASEQPTDPVIELASKVSQPDSVSVMSQYAQVKVKFVDPALTGLITQEKLNFLSAPQHIENLSAIAPVLGKLDILSRTGVYSKDRQVRLPSLPSPKLPTLEYVGYVIEKYVLKGSGVFVKINDIDIPGREFDSYEDTEILYGRTYRYRIKAIVRWTRPSDNIDANKDDTVIDNFASQTKALCSYKSSYLSSEWGHTWAYASCIDDQPPGPPDELIVRPESHKKRIVVTFKLPYDPQKDILSLRLYRKLQNENGRDITNWELVTKSDASGKKQEFPPRNVIFFDKDVDFFQSNGIKYVYAAQCFSRHGEDSVLSEQLVTRLNEKYYTHGEYHVEFLSSPGVRLEYFGAFSTIPHKITKTEIVVTPPATKIGRSPGIASILVSGRNTMGNVLIDGSKYVMRCQSLDTGQSHDIPFELKVSNFPARNTVSNFDFFVSPQTVSGKNSNEFNGGDNKFNEEFKMYRDATLTDDRNEENEVNVYDRSAPGERW